MKHSRFYYSTPAFETRVVVTTNEIGDVVAYPLSSKFTPRPRLTVCGTLDTETNVLSFGAAVCSGKDRFERKIGRSISEKRAAETPLIKVSVTKDNISDVFISTALQLEQQIFGMKNLRLEGNV